MLIKYYIMQRTVFNQAQLDILNLMTWVKSPEVLEDLKQTVSDFFAKKANEEMDRLWKSGEMNEEKSNSFRNIHERTPYHPQ